MFLYLLKFWIIHVFEYFISSIKIFLLTLVDNLCRAREFVIPAHFALGPKAHAEGRRCRGHATKVQMA